MRQTVATIRLMNTPEVASLLAELIRESEGFVDGEWSLDDVRYREGAQGFIVVMSREVDEDDVVTQSYKVNVRALGDDE